MWGRGWVAISTESSGKASMTSEQKPEGDEEARHVAVWEEGFWTEGRVCAKVLW